MLRIEYVYWLCGIILAACALLDLRARRWANGAFWAILAACFLGGEAILRAADNKQVLPEQLAGVGVITLALIAGSGRLHRPPENDAGSVQRRASAECLGNRLFAPALVIPLGTLVLLLLQPWLHVGDVALLDSHQPTLAALGLACVLAVTAALQVTHSTPRMAFTETGRLLNAMSWAALLPMLLATLGAVFAATGVGDAVAHLVAEVIPTTSPTACLLAYISGMVIFTVIMGNAFAAFPVMTAGIGVPLLIGQHHAQAAIIGSLGMLCGYCGTLLTPMAANFNVVPAALLELRDPNGVIRAQWPTALCLLVVNVTLLELLAFR